MNGKHLIVAIDGPAGVGKSTLAKALADKLRVPFLDTGAMFRTLAFRLGEDALSLPPEELRGKIPRFSLDGYGREARLLCDGEAPGLEIRTEEIGGLASRIGARPEIRTILRDEQRKIAQATSLIAEGRDMGTVVFPDATRKFFLDARPEVRAKRRLLDLRAKGEETTLEQVEKMIRQRDLQDRERAVAPLRPAVDAVLIDTSDLPIERILDSMERLIPNPALNFE